MDLVGMTSSLQRIHNHSDAPHPVGLLWTPDQPEAETSTWQHTTLKTDIHAFGGIRTHNPSKRAVADLRVTPRIQWDRFVGLLQAYNDET